jgi:hypothetical protein
MAIGCQLPLRGEPFHGPALPTYRVVPDVLKDARLQDKKRTIYPSAAISRLLTETVHLFAIKLDITEAGRGSYCGYGSKLTMGPMKCEEAPKVNI